MDPETTKLIAALVGPGGVVAVLAYLGQRRNAPEPPAAPPADVAGRTAAGLEALLDELVESRGRLTATRQQVWRCPTEHCPVRDHLRQERP